MVVMTVDSPPYPVAAASNIPQNFELIWTASPSNGGLSRSELTALVHDGMLLRVLGPVYAAVGMGITRHMKAAAIKLTMPPGIVHNAVLHRASAAWFYSCASTPSVVEFLTHREHRSSIRPAPPTATVRWTIRQVLYEPMDVDQFYGVRVTTPLRTAADLACWQHPDAFAALLVMLQAPHLGVNPSDVVRLLHTRPRVPHRPQAVVTIRKACRRLGLDIPKGARL